MLINKILVLLLALSTLAMEALAQNDPIDSGVFRRGHAGPAPNQDSVSLPSLDLGSPSFSGRGCPQGSVSAAITPDGRELSILFDSYSVNAGRAVGRQTDTAACRVILPFNVPPGYHVQIVKVDYRGFNALPSGGRARLTARFGFGNRLARAEQHRPHLSRAVDFSGPLQSEFILSSIVSGPTFSPCGQPFVLAAESLIQVISNRQGEDALTMIDSIDAVSRPIKLGLRWRRCQQGGERQPPGGFPRSPPRPRRVSVSEAFTEK